MLDIKHLTITFKSDNHILPEDLPKSIFDLNLSVAAGEMVAVVGAGGTGKSLLVQTVLGILPSNVIVKGKILFKSVPLTEKRKQRLRGKEITLVPQSVRHLNPLTRVGSQLIRAAKLAGIEPKARRGAAIKALERYALSTDIMKFYPFQLSGGRARRVLTAMATVGAPELIVVDEPTSGLDDATAVESLTWLRYLADRGKGILLVTHNIDAALQVVDTVAVFHAGTIVEIASAEDFQPESSRLRHPYTRSLWQALPQNGFYINFPPTASPPCGTDGCAYAGNCHLADPACLSKRPALLRYNGGHVRCLNARCSI